MNELKETVIAYYTSKLEEHGPTAKGVDWNGEESQRIRFSQLTERFVLTNQTSILDYGCGYGALVDFMRAKGLQSQYIGIDWAGKMIEEAKRLHPADENASFLRLDDSSDIPTADFTIASGIFNTMIDQSIERWKEYVDQTIASLNSSCTSGFSFNMLTSYSDLDRRRRDLYYADPNYYFDLCKREYSKQVALLHDYGLYEFTIVVKKL